MLARNGHAVLPLIQLVVALDTTASYAMPFITPQTQPTPPHPQNLILIAFANFYAAAFVVQALLYCFRGSLTARRIVDQAYRILDWMLGYFLFAFLFLLSFLFVFDKVQGALLFNMKFAKALERSRLLEANYLTSYVDRASERSKKTLKEEVVAELTKEQRAAADKKV
jgi:hypothetical protein